MTHPMTTVQSETAWKLVPVEPTAEMTQAALNASRNNSIVDGVAPLPKGYEIWSAEVVYAAMLASAPASPPPPATEELVERLRIGDKFAKPEDCRRDRCNCDIMLESATALQSQAIALAEAKAREDEWKRAAEHAAKQLARSFGIEHLDWLQAEKSRADSAEAKLKVAEDALAYAAMGLNRIHDSLLRNGPKQASGEMTMHFRDKAREALATIGAKP